MVSDDIEVVRRALMMRDAGYGEPTHIWEQIGTLLQERDQKDADAVLFSAQLTEKDIEIDRLRAALAEAERERNDWRSKYRKLDADREHEIGCLYKVVDRAEADLAAAREVLSALIESILKIEDSSEFQGIWTQLSAHGRDYRGPTWEFELKAARAFVERTAGGVANKTHDDVGSPSKK